MVGLVEGLELALRFFDLALPPIEIKFRLSDLHLHLPDAYLALLTLVNLVDNDLPRAPELILLLLLFPRESASELSELFRIFRISESLNSYNRSTFSV